MEAGLVTGDAVPQEYDGIVEPHVASFDYFLDEGLQDVVERLEPLEIENPTTGSIYRFWFEDPQVRRPVKEDGLGAPNADPRLFPRDCREGMVSYRAPFSIDLCWQTDGGPDMRITKSLGSLPIMVKSSNCYLRNMSRKQLVASREEANEMGGYFICNGLERLIRMLILQRRHYIMGLRRSAYTKRGPTYSDTAVLLRCVAPDQSSATVRIHYLTDGTANFAFTMRRSEYFIPVGVILKCFLEVSDRELYDKLVAAAPAGSAQASFVAERAELLLRAAARLNLKTRAQCLEYLGSHFRPVLSVTSRTTNYSAGLLLLRDYVFIHLAHPADKLQLMIAMMHKLYAVVSRSCCEDNADALAHHELLLPGHLLMKFTGEKLRDCLDAISEMVKKDMEKAPEAMNLDQAYVKRMADKMPQVGKKVEYLLTTGNMVSKSGLDLSQSSGFTVVAEKLNFLRYLSHFRSVHRGAYFAQLRTTAVRKLLPESWGFMCPVHTPDGSPCGLLNHLTAACSVVTAGPGAPEEAEAAIIEVLVTMGMIPAAPAVVPPSLPEYICAMVDGKVVGHISTAAAKGAVARLRQIKVAALAVEEGVPGGPQISASEACIPSHTEVAHIPYELGGPYPGLFIFTQCSRMTRPVKQVKTGFRELIGTLEQCNMAIQCPDGGHGGSVGLAPTHAEINAGAMLSIVASLTPYSDYNQSPRNMYQCQMAKQTMGTPMQAIAHRTDTKFYRLQTPQTPIARTTKYIDYHMDEFPNGANAVVAVLSYTGYDMEDAMILNKSSVERGFAHGTLYKTETIDLREERAAVRVMAAEPQDSRRQGVIPPRPQGAFGQKYPQNIPSLPGGSAVSKVGAAPFGTHADAEAIDTDGLPHVGAIIWPSHHIYSARDQVTGQFKAQKLKGEEVAVVDQVAIVGTKDKAQGIQRANIKMRFNRNPMIGDKFSSRHGQKGVLSMLWPDTNMPFCARTGMRPDLIINPHAFPSRMTIGMLIESLACKAGALNGQFVDATPFQSSDGKQGDPIRAFGDALESAGFSRHGQETMISGLTGAEMPCDIFIGLVYYQRLRHMVSDKFQVRSTGAVNNLTHQPIKGRKFGGGIRFGEMERDSLLAHGAAYLLHDRLHSCSDYHVLDCCTKCGSIIAPLYQQELSSESSQLRSLEGHRGTTLPGRVICPLCDGESRHISRVALPYVFKYLVTELAAMNIKVSVDVK